MMADLAFKEFLFKISLIFFYSFFSNLSSGFSHFPFLILFGFFFVPSPTHFILSDLLSSSFTIFSHPPILFLFFTISSNFLVLLLSYFPSYLILLYCFLFRLFVLPGLLISTSTNYSLSTSFLVFVIDLFLFSYHFLLFLFPVFSSFFYLPIFLILSLHASLFPFFISSFSISFLLFLLPSLIIFIPTPHVFTHFFQ
ncbi:unnamed protein product [Acanthosepion pharaonis]|uniref:Uncharacterized protein n=1 Tax=Acanthosepion pharaonis TaxID=158019 RepID=A0A812C198_ACAPH|nr:unnamed protein product [Sepia pharaonis]